SRSRTGGLSTPPCCGSRGAARRRQEHQRGPREAAEPARAGVTRSCGRSRQKRMRRSRADHGVSPPFEGMYPVGMKTTYTIGQLARATGVPTSTVRYYERMGLLRPSGRTSGNYRVYGEEALERVRFIRAAQATGFTREDITALLNLRDGTTAGCQAVQTL